MDVQSQIVETRKRSLKTGRQAEESLLVVDEKIT